MVLAFSKHGKNHDSGEGIFGEPPRHIKSMPDILVNLLSDSELVLILWNQSAKGFLNEIHLLHRPLSKMNSLQRFSASLGSIKTYKQITLGFDAILSNEDVDSQIIGEPVVKGGGTSRFVQREVVTGFNMMTESHEGKVKLDSSAPVNLISLSTVQTPRSPEKVGVMLRTWTIGPEASSLAEGGVGVI
jgi:hypothetical protein